MTTPKKKVVRAHVTVQVTFAASSSWGSDTTLDQIHRNVAREAEAAVMHLLAGKHEFSGARVKVSGVTAELWDHHGGAE